MSRRRVVEFCVAYTVEGGVISYFVRANRLTVGGNGEPLRRETFDHAQKVQKSYVYRQHDNTAARLCPFGWKRVYETFHTYPDLDGEHWTRRTGCDDLGDVGLLPVGTRVEL